VKTQARQNDMHVTAASLHAARRLLARAGGSVRAPADSLRSEFDRLRGKYNQTSDRILFCIRAMQRDDDVLLDDLKAEARLHGLLVTAASMNAARRLLTHERRPAGDPVAEPPVTEPNEVPTTAIAVPAPAGSSPWDIEFDRLRQRFPGAKPPVLFCIHALQQRPDVALLDLKAQAAMHGVKVTNSAWDQARQLLAPPAAEAQPRSLQVTRDPTTTPRQPAPTAQSAPTATPATTQAKAVLVAADAAEGPVERMTRFVIAALQAAGEAKAEQLRCAIHEALTVIGAALDGDSTE